MTLNRLLPCPRAGHLYISLPRGCAETGAGLAETGLHLQGSRSLRKIGLATIATASSAPLIALASCRFKLVNRLERWRAIFASRAAPVIAREHEGRARYGALLTVAGSGLPWWCDGAL